MEEMRTFDNSERYKGDPDGGSWIRSKLSESNIKVIAIAVAVITCALFYTIITVTAVVVFDHKLYEIQREQTNINQRYLKLNKSNAQIQEDIQNLTAQDYSTVRMRRPTEEEKEKKEVKVKSCDSTLTINNKVYTVTDTSIGAYTDKPCATIEGYISVGCRYVCQSSGKWAVVQNKGSIKIYYTVTTWHVANSVCTADNATLLIIPDEAYFNTIREMVIPMISDIQFRTSCGTATNKFWIGANDLNLEGVFKWVNGDSYSPWHNQKQVKDNRGCDGNPADCSLISVETGVWEDRRCGATLPFICQKY